MKILLFNASKMTKEIDFYAKFQYGSYIYSKKSVGL